MEGNDRVVFYPLDYSQCTGCKSCEMLCSLFHDGVNSPQLSSIKLGIGPIKTMLHEVYTCQHCTDHPCYNACPKQDEALCIDEDGIVYVNRDNCIGCGLCVKACPYNPPRIHVAKLNGKRFAVKCDLCRNIESGPACVRNCPAMVLGLASESTEDLSRPLSAVEGD
ncbi:4Fe-4S dicluster domain-containing protein [Slackia piriformis]|nr:4Fe-4S dicluster domain-containing protein [Slackia piriformis]